MLSSGTKTEVSHEVFRSLRTTFGTWENLRAAPILALEDAIRAATFPETKALNLRASLQQVTARSGELSLDFLAKYKIEKIRVWLEPFDGIGPKNQRRCGQLQHPSPQRDVHRQPSSPHRASPRTVPASADAGPTEEQLMEIALTNWTAEFLDDHHSLVKLHGQQTCIKSQPLCAGCPLLDLCPTGVKIA